MQSLSFNLDLIIETSCSLTLYMTCCGMASLMCQTHRQLPGLDVITLLTDIPCVLILLFPGKNKDVSIKHSVESPHTALVFLMKPFQMICLQRPTSFGWYHSLQIQTVREDKLLLLHV